MEGFYLDQAYMDKIFNADDSDSQKLRKIRIRLSEIEDRITEIREVLEHTSSEKKISSLKKEFISLKNEYKCLLNIYSDIDNDDNRDMSSKQMPEHDRQFLIKLIREKLKKLNNLLDEIEKMFYNFGLSVQTKNLEEDKNDLEEELEML